MTRVRLSPWRSISGPIHGWSLRMQYEGECERVTLCSPDGGSRDLDIDHFLAIPLATRVQYIIEGRVTFYSGGSAVDEMQALNDRRRAAATSSPAST